MSAASDSAEPTPPAPTPPAFDDAYLAQTLRHIIDAGLQLAQELVADRTTPAIDKAVAYERIARAIRRTVLLAQALTRPAKPIASARPARRTRDADIAVANRAEPPERREAPERPERPETPERPESIAAELAFIKRPIPDILAAIRRDLRWATRRMSRRRHAHPGRSPRVRAAHHPRANPPNRAPPLSAKGTKPDRHPRRSAPNP